MQTIRKDIRSGHFRRVYLIYGEETYLREELKRELTEAVVGEDTMNSTFLEGEDLDVTALIDMAQTLPFFASRRLILVENCGLFKRESGALTDALPDFPETTCLVFVEKDVDRRGKLYKKVSSLGHAAECRRLTQGERRQWVRQSMNRAGKRMAESALTEFLNRTGEDMENICREMDKLISYAGERETVTREDVCSITTAQVSDRIFEMIHAIAARDSKRALDLYCDLLVLREAPMKILVLIGRQFRCVLQVKDLQERGVPPQEIAARGKWKSFVAQRYMSQAARFDRRELEKDVELCVEAEESVKQGKMRDSLAAETLIVTLSTGIGSETRRPESLHPAE